MDSSRERIKPLELINPWLVIYDKNGNDGDYLGVFFRGDFSFYDITCLEDGSYHKDIFHEISIRICNMLLNVSIIDLCKQLTRFEEYINVTPQNIPQFSNLNHGTVKVVDILARSGNLGLTYNEIGEYLTNPGKKAIANKKYGENHSKLAQLLGLVIIKRESAASKVYLSPIGEVFQRINAKEKEKLVSRLILRIPVIQEILISASRGQTKISDHLHSLSMSTLTRRKPNVKQLINLLSTFSEGKMEYWFDNIERN